MQMTESPCNSALATAVSSATSITFWRHIAAREDGASSNFLRWRDRSSFALAATIASDNALRNGQSPCRKTHKAPDAPPAVRMPSPRLQYTIGNMSWVLMKFGEPRRGRGGVFNLNP